MSLDIKAYRKAQSKKQKFYNKRAKILRQKRTSQEKKFHQILKKVLALVYCHSKFFMSQKQRTLKGLGKVFVDFYVRITWVPGANCHHYYFEIDGGYHEQIKERDASRDYQIQRTKRSKIFRFTNNQVDSHPEEVEKKLMDIFQVTGRYIFKTTGDNTQCQQTLAAQTVMQ